MIELDDYFGKVSHIANPTAEIEDNARVLLEKVNKLVRNLPFPFEVHVNSGWRPPEYNKTIPGAAPNSKHMTGQAIDLGDPDGQLDDYLSGNPEVIIQHDLYMEHPLSTKGWCHLQSIPPRSGKRIFYP